MNVLYALAIVVVLVFIWAKLNRSTGERLPRRDLSPPSGGGTEADVERLVEAGRRIDAIKLYREIHTVELKEAKEAVDRLAGRLDRGPRE